MLMKLLKFSGYLIYTVVVVLALLWYKFPADAVKTRIEQDLNRTTPDLQWVVEKFTLLPPLRVQLQNIQVTGRGEQKKIFSLHDLTLRPDLMTWKKTGKVTAQYIAHLLKGTVSGRLALTKNRKALQYNGVIQDLTIDNNELPLLQEEYQRDVHGTLSGQFSGKRNLTDITHTMQGKFVFTRGSIGLQQAVLGMDQIDFDRLETQLNMNTGTVVLSQGKVTSPLFAAEFKGNLRMAVPCSHSDIRVTGSFQPGPKFTASLDSPSLAALLNKEMQKGSLPLTVNGPLKKPGIVFTSLPPGFNSQMELLKKQL
ncbi:MAG: type II secretion system protein GspN, partial [Candidatus Electrothrix sp. AUS4]|nr:type II secretion system protein GspN [Candidatus Electrothrix sp. AUS4]